MNFSKEIQDWYFYNARKLPWRTTRDPYRIWLSEVILQQTRVEQGRPYYLKFIENYPTVYDLAAASEEEVLKLWQGLGYYSRARNLHFTAKEIVNRYNGVFPDQFKEIIKLKGVGDYTASAIASICYNLPKAVVDGNVYRVLSRVFGMRHPVDTTPGKKAFKELADQLLDTENPGNYNQAIMEFGALQCKPKNPDCFNCPLQSICVAHREGLIGVLPHKAKKVKVSKRYLHYMIINNSEGQLCMQKRTTGIWRNLYEFPLLETSKPIAVKSVRQKIRDSEFLKELQPAEVRLKNDQPVQHQLSHRQLYIYFWMIDIADSNSLVSEPGPNSQWVTHQEIQKLPVPVVIERFLADFL